MYVMKEKADWIHPREIEKMTKYVKETVRVGVMYVYRHR